MEVYRITTKKWSTKLSGSGFAARWNSQGKFVVYTSSSRALSSLENIVHRSAEGLNSLFKTIIIQIPNNLKIETIESKNLPLNWHEFKMYPVCQEIGDKWLAESKSAVLKVPSSIIKEEFNFLLNPNHKSFKRIKILSIENFVFDSRLKTNE